MCRVEMDVREVKRQCRTLRLSAEQNTSVRIADDYPLLSWLPRFAAQVVGHHDRTEAVLWITKNGVVRGTSWTTQTLSDAWESTNWEGLCGTLWQMVAPEFKLTKTVTTDKEGAGPPLPRIVVERAPEVEPRRFYVLSADIEAHGHTGGFPGCAALASHGKATKPHNDECRERIRTIIERILTAKARMNAYTDRIAETERVKERQRARVERGAGDVLMEPGNRGDEQVASARQGQSEAQAILSQEAHGVLPLPLHCNRMDCCLSLRCVRTEFVEVIRLTDHDASFAFASSDGDTEFCRSGARVAVTQQ